MNRVTGQAAFGFSQDVLDDLESVLLLCVGLGPDYDLTLVTQLQNDLFRSFLEPRERRQRPASIVVILGLVASELHDDVHESR